jgi:hypothetical protein
VKKLIPLLVLASILIAGCSGGPITIGVPGEQPSILSFNAEPSTISAGGTSNLSWNVSGATTITIDQGIGNIALTGTRAVSPAATTVYTLTASSSAGTATATTQVVVSGSAIPTPTPTPTPTPAGLPVIGYFTANPPLIPGGSSTTLSWSVSNATSVMIDNGIGAVPLTGSTVVSPPSNINYTLTATNASGWVSLTVTVLVGSAVPSGMPDLVITDIVNSSGTINYTIKNQGDAASGPSTSTLLVDGATVANDSVGSLAPGQSATEAFTSYAYSCTLPGDDLVVNADTGNTVVESSEANNSFTKSWSCLLITVPIGPLHILSPDLTVEDVWLVHEITGDKIYYRVKNNGVIASGASTSYLYVYPCVFPCSPSASDSVASLDAGASRVEKFSSYNYTGTHSSVTVKVDATGAVNESDEDNNSFSKSGSAL